LAATSDFNTWLTQSDLKSLLHYDPETGLFRWLVNIRQAVRVGDIAGTTTPGGYIVIRIARRGYQAHRLAWLYMTGKWPDDQIDHEDLNKANNIWSNLRPATHQQNQANRRAFKTNKLGLKGVALRRRDNKYLATICWNGKIKFLGAFATPEAAHAAYTSAAIARDGEFARAA